MPAAVATADHRSPSCSRCVPRPAGLPSEHQAAHRPTAHQPLPATSTTTQKSGRYIRWSKATSATGITLLVGASRMKNARPGNAHTRRRNAAIAAATNATSTTASEPAAAAMPSTKGQS